MVPLPFLGCRSQVVILSLCALGIGTFSCFASRVLTKGQLQTDTVSVFESNTTFRWTPAWTLSGCSLGKLVASQDFAGGDLVAARGGRGRWICGRGLPGVTGPAELAGGHLGWVGILVGNIGFSIWWELGLGIGEG